MRKLVVIVGFLALIGVAAAFVTTGTLSRSEAQQATPQAKATVIAKRANTQVVSEARVVPVTTASLALAAGGLVAEVPVSEGERVEANQVLVRLDSRQQAAAVAQAQAALKGAQARLDELKAGARPQEVAVAEAALASAQAALQKLQQGPDEQQFIAARAELANAEAALRQAYAGYDRAGGAANPEAGMLPTSLALEQATNAATAAKARVAALQKGPRAADLAMARADIQRAQAQLDLANAGPRPETVAALESEIASAKAAIEQAELALANAELHAPFAGTVATLNAKVGEHVAPGAPIVQLANCLTWQIETTDLTELNIARVHEGDAVTITFDALSGLTLPGTVTRVKTIGENKQGDIVYTVVVRPERMDERLRWNMTAKVTIEAK
jgi:HlyD family secretion protein